MFEYSGLTLRNVEDGDLESMRALRNDPSTWTMLTSPGFVDRSGQEIWFGIVRNSVDKKYYVIFDESHDFIGIVRTDEIDPHNRSIRVGVDIAPELRGLGYGKRAYGLIKKFFFDEMNMHRLWLAVLDGNDKALKLYLEEGFSIEGRYREAVFRNGAYRDYIIMSILENDYRAGQKS